MEKFIDKEGDPSKHHSPDASKGEVEIGESIIGYEGDVTAAVREGHEATTTTKGNGFVATMSKLTIGAVNDKTHEGEADFSSDDEIATQAPWSPISSVESLEQLPSMAYSAQSNRSGYILPVTTDSPVPKRQGNQLSATVYRDKTTESEFMLPATTYAPVSKQRGTKVSATAYLARPQTTKSGFMLPATTYTPVDKQQRAQPMTTVGASSSQKTGQQLPATTSSPASNQQEAHIFASTYSTQAQAMESGFMHSGKTYTSASEQQRVQLTSTAGALSTQEPSQEIVVSRFPCISKEEGAKILANAYTTHALGPDFMLPRSTYSAVSEQKHSQAAAPTYAHPALKQPSYQAAITAGASATQNSSLQLPTARYLSTSVDSGYMLPATKYLSAAPKKHPAEAPITAGTLSTQQSDPQLQATNYSPAAPKHEGPYVPVAMGPSSARKSGSWLPAATHSTYAAALQSSPVLPATKYSPAASKSQRDHFLVTAHPSSIQVPGHQLLATTFAPSASGQHMPQRPATAASFAIQNTGHHLPATTYSPAEMQRSTAQFTSTRCSAPTLIPQKNQLSGAASSFSTLKQPGDQLPATEYSPPASKLLESQLSPTATPFFPGQPAQQLSSSTYRPSILNNSGILVPTTTQQYDAGNQYGGSQFPQTENSSHAFKQPSKLSPTARSFCTQLGATYSFPVSKKNGTKLPKSESSDSTSKQSETQLPPKIAAATFSNGSPKTSDTKSQGDHSSDSISQPSGIDLPAKFYTPSPTIQQQTRITPNCYAPVSYDPAIHPAFPSDMPNLHYDSHDLRINTGTIEFNNVTYAYKRTDEAAALRDVSLHIKGGESVAVVGLTGAGKSTLLKLLMGQKDNYTGCVKIDGVDIRGVSFQSLMKQIAVVPQCVSILDGSVWDNVGYGVEASSEKVIEVCRVVGLHHKIMRLRNGYNTRLGMGGIDVSRSVRARLAIARLLLRDPKIVLLDACLRYIDRKAEYRIIRYLRKWCVGRTVIAIAHRVGIVTLSDRIYVMTRGILVQSGTHRELFHTEGLYKKLWIKKRIV